MSRSSSDLNQMQAFVVMIPLTISNLALVAGVVVILFITDPLLALVALAPLPLVNVAAHAVLARRSTRRCWRCRPSRRSSPPSSRRRSPACG